MAVAARFTAFLNHPAGECALLYLSLITVVLPSFRSKNDTFLGSQFQMGKLSRGLSIKLESRGATTIHSVNVFPTWVKILDRPFWGHDCLTVS